MELGLCAVQTASLPLSPQAGAGSASSVAPVPAVPHMPQFSKALLICPKRHSCCAIDRTAHLTPEVHPDSWRSSACWLHLTVLSLASPFSSLGFLPLSAFQVSYSKPASFKSVVKANPARQQTTAPVRALCRPIPPLSSFLLTKMFPYYFISQCALRIWLSLDPT